MKLLKIDNALLNLNEIKWIMVLTEDFEFYETYKLEGINSVIYMGNSSCYYVKYTIGEIEMLLSEHLEILKIK